MSWLRLRHILKRVKIKSRETQTYKALSGGGFLRGMGVSRADEVKPVLRKFKPLPLKEKNKKLSFIFYTLNPAPTHKV